MYLMYDNKDSEQFIFDNVVGADIKVEENSLYKGDNLSILRSLLDFYENRIDLIYIDPPFSTKKCV